MNGFHYSDKQRQRGDPLSDAQRGLILISLFFAGISLILFLIAQPYLAGGQPGQFAAPSPIVRVPSPAPLPSPSPSSTPTPSLTPMPSPSLTPTPLPGMLRYPLYSGNAQLPEIALTFDDGPTPLYTSQILTILKSYHVNATFFVIGDLAANFPNLVRQEYQQGNVVGNHTWTHPELIKLSAGSMRAELQRTSNKIQSITGKLPLVFRPPYEEFNGTVRLIAASLGLSTVLWNVDPKDWSLPGTGAITQNVLHAVRNGSIIIMHDGGGNRSETVTALPTILTTLRQRGFQFVTIPRMIQDLSSAAQQPVLPPPPQLSPESSFSTCDTLPCPSAFIERKKVSHLPADRKP